MRSPQKDGQIIKIADVRLEIKLETEPCDLMDKQRQGLQTALTPSWRGGVCCNVVQGGTISIGDNFAISNNKHYPIIFIERLIKKYQLER